MKLLFFELRAERSAPMMLYRSFPRWIPHFIVKFAVLGLMIVLAASLAACGGTTAPSSSSGPVTLTFWTWSQVTQGSKVYAIPQDSGPMGLLYRKDIFDQYHLAVPQTWAQYEQEAIALHKANPQIYMTDFPPSDPGWFNGLLWQAGSRPFKVNGTNVSININDPAALQVANYWGNLIDQKVVQTAPDFTTDWYTGLAKGTYATWVTAAWGPVFLSGVAAQSAGKWRAAPLPQWTAGGQATANWGGSTDAVTTQSQHPKEAAEFAMWLNHDQNSATMFAQKQFLFPVLNG